MVPFSMEVGPKKVSFLVRLQRELKSSRQAGERFPDVHECLRCHFVETCEESLRSYEEKIHEGDAAVSDEIRQGRRFHLQ